MELFEILIPLHTTQDGPDPKTTLKGDFDAEFSTTMALCENGGPC